MILKHDTNCKANNCLDSFCKDCCSCGASFSTLSDLDKAWAEIYWTFEENAFDLSDNHIGRYTCPVPFSNTKYFESYAEVPF